MTDSGDKKKGADGEKFNFVEGAKVFFATVAISSLVLWSAGALGWWLGGRYPLPEFLKVIFGG